MAAELIVAFGSFSAMIVPWALLPSGSRHSAKQEVEKKEGPASHVLAGE